MGYDICRDSNDDDDDDKDYDVDDDDDDDDDIDLYAGGERRLPSSSRDCWTALIISCRRRGSCL